MVIQKKEHQEELNNLQSQTQILKVEDTFKNYFLNHVLFIIFTLIA